MVFRPVQSVKALRPIAVQARHAVGELHMLQYRAVVERPEAHGGDPVLDDDLPNVLPVGHPGGIVLIIQIWDIAGAADIQDSVFCQAPFERPQIAAVGIIAVIIEVLYVVRQIIQHVGSQPDLGGHAHLGDSAPLVVP